MTVIRISVPDGLKSEIEAELEGLQVVTGGLGYEVREDTTKAYIWEIHLDGILKESRDGAVMRFIRDKHFTTVSFKEE